MAASSVGIQSIEIMTCSDTVPAAIRPGQRAIAGIRSPPSSNSPFIPVNGQVLENRSPPLSLVKTTIELLARPVASSACSTRPTFMSRLCTMVA